jgi:hypothetical protein
MSLAVAAFIGSWVFTRPAGQIRAVLRCLVPIRRQVPESVGLVLEERRGVTSEKANWYAAM